MDVLIDEAVKFAFVLLTPLALAVLYKGFAKLGLQIDAEKQGKIEAAVRIAVAEAEEWASRQIKARIKVNPRDKFERALETVIVKLPNVDPNEATTIIHAMLPQMGLGAAAGARALGEAVRTPKRGK